MKILKTILSLFLIFLIINGTTTWAVAKHYCTISGVSKVNFIDSKDCCKAMPINMADHRCKIEFDAPECCEVDLIQHIGENTILKRGNEVTKSLAANDMMEKVEVFETLPPVTYTPPPSTDLIFQQASPRLAYLQVFRL